MAGAILGGLFGKKKADPAPAASTSTDGTNKPVIANLSADDPRRRNKGGAPVTRDFRTGMATILSDKLGA